jgi:prevent-host-death family protein
MERIGVRELRQHASRYLARVAAGESLEVTDRGQPVAHLVPVPTDPWAELVSRGLVRPAAAGADLLDVRALKPPAGAPSTDEVLADLRADER